MKRHIRNTTRGFSLVEVIVALALLSLVMLSVISVTGVSADFIIDSGKLRKNYRNSFSAIENGEGTESAGSVVFSIGDKLFSADVTYRSYGSGLSRLYLFEA